MFYVYYINSATSQVAVLEEQVFYPHLMSSVMETSTGNEGYALQCNMG
jgi:hypothetical protein